ncbi:MAG: SHOCT domain-containing protein [Thermomicrobiales bacterium]|nr:SHOCT domain-containing protein [Thermomicrobiales bacterium]
MRRPARAGRPSLMGTMARTAVIAGTATAVSGKVAAGQQAKAAQQQTTAAAQQAVFDSQAQLTELQNQVASMQTQQAAAAAPSAPPAGDLIAQLERLGQLKAAGILSDAEFEAAKARLLAG